MVIPLARHTVQAPSSTDTSNARERFASRAEGIYEDDLAAIKAAKVIKLK
jgi:hypothetical protein